MAFCFDNIVEKMPSTAPLYGLNQNARASLRGCLNLPDDCRIHDLFVAFGKARADALYGTDDELKENYSVTNYHMVRWKLSSTILQLQYNRILHDRLYFQGIKADSPDTFGKIILTSDICFEYLNGFMYPPKAFVTRIVTPEVGFGASVVKEAYRWMEKSKQTEDEDTIYESVHCLLQGCQIAELRAFIKYLVQAEVTRMTYVETACPTNSKKEISLFWYPRWVAEWCAGPLLKQDWELFFALTARFGLDGAGNAVGHQILQKANPRGASNYVNLSSHLLCADSLESLFGRYYRTGLHREEQFALGSPPIYRCPHFNTATRRVSEELTLQYKSGCDQKFETPVELQWHMEDSHDKKYYRDCESCGGPILDYAGPGHSKELDDMCDLYHAQTCPAHVRRYADAWSPPADIEPFRFPAHRSVTQATRELLHVTTPMYLSAPRNATCKGQKVCWAFLIM